VTGTALLAAASGIGDVVRVTPLVRVLHALGYTVDVLLAPDYPETACLLEGAPEIRRLFCTPSQWLRAGEDRTAGLSRECYDVAAFTALALPLRRRVQTRRALAFDLAQWRAGGDVACVASVASQLGWEGALPPPFVRTSGRRFDLEAGTVAIHPGCKPAWGWKRWHGHAALAGLLSSVVLVGTEADLADDPTAYFHAPGAWPSHVRSFVGALDLLDTAALLSQCDALVANDSGLMHVAAALGVPTFAVFGLTSPAREAMPLPNLHAITAGLPCEQDCRRRPWGRTGCEHQLRCLRTLRPEAVLARVREHLPVSCAGHD
jgi:ADP-heptose:LPS heptosyltransferase